MILPKTRSSRIPGFSGRPRSDRILSEIIAQQSCLTCGQWVSPKPGVDRKEIKLEISMATVCTSVNICKVQEIVYENKKITNFRDKKDAEPLCATSFEYTP